MNALRVSSSSRRRATSGTRGVRFATGSAPGTMRVPWCAAGSKAAAHTRVPAYGVWGASTGNEGRFLLAVPGP